MKSLLLCLIISLICISCKGQPSKTNKAVSQDGVVYFSDDGGLSWKNKSNGLPDVINIPLGGISTSDNRLLLSTKQNGVFDYRMADSSWHNLATDSSIIKANIGGLISFKNKIYLGTQHSGLFVSASDGASWKEANLGLNNLTIRRLMIHLDKLYLCTNDGFYVLEENKNRWRLVFGEMGLQVNGATVFHDNFYLATNKGVFRGNSMKTWQNVMANNSVHNVSSDADHLYAMTYTSLLMNSTDGKNWTSLQEGLPKSLYTFNILKQNNYTLAGQWDGVYIRTTLDTKWRLSNKGLPERFAVTNMKDLRGTVVVTTSERKLKDKVTLDK